MRPSCCQKEKKLSKKDPERGLFSYIMPLKYLWVICFYQCDRGTLPTVEPVFFALLWGFEQFPHRKWV